MMDLDVLSEKILQVSIYCSYVYIYTFEFNFVFPHIVISQKKWTYLHVFEEESLEKKYSTRPYSWFAINLSGCGTQCQPPTPAGSDNGTNKIFLCVVPPTWPP